MIELLLTEADAGRAYTVRTFAETFARRDNLPSYQGITKLLSLMATRGLVAYSTGVPTGVPLHPKSFGHVVCEGYAYAGQAVIPTHYRDPEADQVLPLGEPMTWGDL